MVEEDAVSDGRLPPLEDEVPDYEAEAEPEHRFLVDADGEVERDADG